MIVSNPYTKFEPSVSNPGSSQDDGVQDPKKRNIFSGSTKPLKKRRCSYDNETQMYPENIDLSILAALASHQHQLEQAQPPLYLLPVIHTTHMYNKYVESMNNDRNNAQSQVQPVHNSTEENQCQDHAENVTCVEILHFDSKQNQLTASEKESSISIPLSLPEDKEKLSRLQCFLREQIEIFIATAEDATTYSRGRNKRVEVGQAGIRCKHCSTIPVKDRSKGSTYFPSTLTGIYQAAQNMYHYHFCTGCPVITQKYPSHFNEVLSSRSCYGGGKDYWSFAAEKMGLIETAVGLRLKNYSSNYVDDESSTGSSSEVDESSIRELELAAEDTSNIVKPEDRSLITDYTFMLFSQMFPCHPAKPTENSLPGLICKHCEGCNGSGAFFRTKVSSLSKNENLAQIDKHLRECCYCPDKIKTALKNLKEIHPMQTRGLKRGHKKAFFTQMMTRISSQPSNIRTHLNLDVC